MLEKKLDNKISSLLKIKTESIDVKPPIEPSIVSHTLGNETVPVQNINVAELINKQTEMILNLIKEQNLLIQRLLEARPQIPSNVPVSQEEFKEKLITFNFDEQGNPVSAEVKLKPIDESKLSLEELEKDDSLIIKDL